MTKPEPGKAVQPAPRSLCRPTGHERSEAMRIEAMRKRGLMVQSRQRGNRRIHAGGPLLRCSLAAKAFAMPAA